jgi:hypothetical protein
MPAALLLYNSIAYFAWGEGHTTTKTFQSSSILSFRKHSKPSFTAHLFVRQGIALQCGWQYSK